MCYIQLDNLLVNNIISIIMYKYNLKTTQLHTLAIKSNQVVFFLIKPEFMPTMVRNQQ